MFQFVGLATLFKVDRPPAGRVSPFGHPRINGRSRLLAAFRSLPRPSSPPGAKASPVRPLVLVAYHNACPAASRRGTLLSILALLSELKVESLKLKNFQFSIFNSQFVCLSFHPVKEPSPGLPGSRGEQGIRTLDPQLAELVL